MIAYPCNKGANQLWGLVARGGAVGLTNALDSPPLCLNTEIGNSPDKATSYVIMAMRIANYVHNGPPPSGYTLRVSASILFFFFSFYFLCKTRVSPSTADQSTPGCFHHWLSLVLKPPNLNSIFRIIIITIEGSHHHPPTRPTYAYTVRNMNEESVSTNTIPLVHFLRAHGLAGTLCSPILVSRAYLV